MKKFFFCALCAFILVLAAFGISSCNVTRTVTTLASHYVSGDTTTTIITKTIESYDAKKYENWKR